MFFKFFIRIVLAFIIFCSCSSNLGNSIEQDDGIKRLKAINDETNPSEEVPLYDKVEFVSLETNDKCLITNIQSMLIRDSLIYILDSSTNLFVFNRQGHFKRQIGSLGQGPAEYIKINSFFIDKTKQCIVIVDDMKKAFLYYDFNGNFIQKRGVPWELITMIDKSSMISDDHILMNYCIYPEDLYNIGEQAYRLLKIKNMKILDSKSYNPIKATGAMFPFSSHPMTETEKGFNFIMPVCDTIFNCHNGKFRPEYIIEHKLEMVPKERFQLSGKDRDSFIGLAIKFCAEKYFAGFNGIYETDNRSEERRVGKECRSRWSPYH